MFLKSREKDLINNPSKKKNQVIYLFREKKSNFFN